MKLLVILCVTAVYAVELKTSFQECNGFFVGGTFYRKEVLAKGLNRPYQLAYYQHKKELFFSHNVGDDDEDQFEIGVIRESSAHHEVIKVPNGFAIAIDEKEHEAFFGGSDGVYKDNLNSKAKTPLARVVENLNIWDMFFKHHLYFITYPMQKLYKYTNNKKPEREKWVHEKIYQFAIDGDGDTFLTNETGLYLVKKGSQERHQIHGETVFRAVEINNKGKAHFCGLHGIYVPLKHNHTLHRIAHVKNIFGLTFDHEDNIIYSNPHEIVKLTQSFCNIEKVDVPYVPLPIP